MNAKMKKAELIDLFENFDGDRKSDFIETYPEIWDDVYDIMEGSRYHRAMINCVKAGFEARDRIAQEREKKLVKCIESQIEKLDWLISQEWSREYNIDGLSNEIIMDLKEALTNYKAEGE